MSCLPTQHRIDPPTPSIWPSTFFQDTDHREEGEADTAGHTHLEASAFDTEDVMLGAVQKMESTQRLSCLL